MSYIIALAGKGGTGKTTVAALIIRAIKELKLGSILAIDADPNSNLGELLGINNPESIGTILDEISANPDKIPSGMTKDRFIQFKVQSAVFEGEGVDLLNMGKPEGPGCYCFVNNVLRGAMTELIKNYDFVIIDNEAGLEHLSRRTTRTADALIVVSDATSVGLKSASRIKDLVKELKFEVKKRFLLINRFNPKVDKEKINATGLDYLGNLPLDADIEAMSLAGKSVFDLKNDALILKALKVWGEKIWIRS